MLFKFLVILLSIALVFANDDDDDGKPIGDYIGVYLAVLVIALPFAAHVLDCLGIFNTLIYRLGDKVHLQKLLYQLLLLLIFRRTLTL